MSFPSQVLEADIPVLEDIRPTHCPPCRLLDPIITKLARDLDGQVPIRGAPIDDNSLVAQDYGALTIPTLVLFTGE